MEVEFILPAELSIFTAAQTTQDLLTALNAALGANLDGFGLRVGGQRVEDVDGAGVQVLLSLHQWCQARQVPWILEQPSPALKKACELLSFAPAAAWGDQAGVDLGLVAPLPSESEGVHP